MKENSTIVLAAGGTGGHIFPAQALAEELSSRGCKVYLITDKRFSGYVTDIPVEEILFIKAGRLGDNIIKKIFGLMSVGAGVLQAMIHLKKIKAGVVVGFGGYPSFPTMIAAIILGIPTIIHEQNAVLGRANRKLMKRVNHIATSFKQTHMIDEKNQHKVVVTGNPVRSSVRALAHLPYRDIGDDTVINILVIGGSQGASIFSQIVPAAIASLPAPIRARLRVDQQCRPDDLEVTREAYKQLGVSANLAPFFSDISTLLAAAHLVITRAGASSLTELAIAGRPAILVPLPTAMDNHQYINANAFEDIGAGWVMSQDGFTAAALSARLETFMTAPRTLITAASAAKRIGHLKAAEHLADLVEKTARKESHA